MAAHTIWDGSLSFGLVNIGVSLQSMEKSREISFNLLDKRDHAPVGYVRINKSTGEELPWEQIVKGYKYEKDQYVIMNDKDFKNASIGKTEAIDIFGFVKGSDIPPVYFEKPYYLAPQKKSLKSYVLLKEALESSGRVGLSKIVIRAREHLAAIFPYAKGLVLEILRFQHELKTEEELEAPAKVPTISKKEREMAEQIITGMKEEWKPEKYRDDYYDELMNIIDKKIDAGQGKSVASEKEHSIPKHAPTREQDLMAMLKKSLSGNNGASQKATSRARPRARSKASKVHRKKAA